VEAECARQKEHIAALELKITDLSANEKDDLGLVKQRNAEIEELAVRLRAATQKLSAFEAEQDQYVAARVGEARRDIENRVRAALGGDNDNIEPDTANKAGPEADPAPQPRRKAARTKRAASASARPRPRADQPKRRGRDTEQLVLDLLTFEWKSVSMLFRSARQIGFSGSENAIRFAAERLIAAGNAVQGRNAEGHVAFRRA
jgi:small-conductance mechanosensitive channel